LWLLFVSVYSVAKLSRAGDFLFLSLKEIEIWGFAVVISIEQTVFGAQLFHENPDLVDILWGIVFERSFPPLHP